MVKTDASPIAVTEPLRSPIPKPKGLKLFRRFEWILDPVNYLEKAKAEDFFEEDTLGFGDGKVVITSHPEAMQFILSRDRSAFNSPGEFNRLLAPLIGDASVIMLSGNAHKARRRLTTPAFHGERLDVYGRIICDLTHAAVAELQPGEAFSTRNLTQQVSLQIISKVVFGLTDSPRSKALSAALTETVDSFGSPVSAMMLFFTQLQKDLGEWSPWGKFLRLRNRLDTLIYEEIESRQDDADPTRTDILSMLMAARTEEGEALSKAELRDELMTLLMAGHETTATSIAWAMYWVHKLPAVKEKLLAELESVGEQASPMEIAQLPYLSAVCSETLRRSPVAMFTFPRIAQEPVDILGRHFPAETIFLGCIFLTHQREDIYPDPKAFRPERFLDQKFSPYEFMAFGGGARRCVGAALAQYEMKLAIATLLGNYSFKLASDKPEIAKRRGVTLAPANGVPMVFVGHRPSP
ncbi:MAG: cytochrome P450 [Cyanobacteria bacterium P01_D01_bin.105]